MQAKQKKSRLFDMKKDLSKTEANFVSSKVTMPTYQGRSQVFRDGGGGDQGRKQAVLGVVGGGTPGPRG